MAPKVEWRGENSTDDGSDAHSFRHIDSLPDLVQDVGSNGFRREDDKDDGNEERKKGGGGRGGERRRDAKQPAERSEEVNSGFRQNNATSNDNSRTAEAEQNRRVRQQRIETFKRVLCCLGWLLCCPVWTLGFCLREQPDSLEELRGDPCWPCDENTSSTLRN